MSSFGKIQSALFRPLLPLPIKMSPLPSQPQLPPPPPPPSQTLTVRKHNHLTVLAQVNPLSKKSS